MKSNYTPLRIAVVFYMVLFGCKRPLQKKVNHNQDKALLVPAQIFELANPLIEVEKTLFKDSTMVHIRSPHPNAVVHYSTVQATVGKESPIYKNSFYISKNTTLTAKAFHADYKESEAVQVQVFKIKNNLINARITSRPMPHPKYTGKGLSTLIDHKKGQIAFRNGKEWLGYNVPEIVLKLSLEAPLELHKVTLGTLIDQEAWIFGPRKIEVFCQQQLLNQITLEHASNKQTAQLNNIIIPVPKKYYETLEIKIQSLSEIPEWHPGKGTQGWLFLDQILLD